MLLVKIIMGIMEIMGIIIMVMIIRKMGIIII